MGKQPIIIENGGSTIGILPKSAVAMRARKTNLNGMKVEWSSSSEDLAEQRLLLKRGSIPELAEAVSQGITLQPSVREYDFNNLLPGTVYGFRVASLNADGQYQTYRTDGNSTLLTTSDSTQSVFVEIALPTTTATSFGVIRTKDGKTFLTELGGECRTLLLQSDGTWIPCTVFDENGTATTGAFYAFYENDNGDIFTTRTGTSGLFLYNTNDNCFRRILTGVGGERFVVYKTSGGITFFSFVGGVYRMQSDNTFVQVLTTSSAYVLADKFMELRTGEILLSYSGYYNSSSYRLYGFYRYDTATDAFVQVCTSGYNHTLYEFTAYTVLTDSGSAAIWIYEDGAVRRVGTNLNTSYYPKLLFESSSLNIYVTCNSIYATTVYRFADTANFESLFVGSKSQSYFSKETMLDFENGEVFFPFLGSLYDETTGVARTNSSYGTSGLYVDSGDWRYIFTNPQTYLKYNMSTKEAIYVYVPNLPSNIKSNFLPVYCPRHDLMLFVSTTTNSSYYGIAYWDKTEDVAVGINTTYSDSTAAGTPSVPYEFENCIVLGGSKAVEKYCVLNTQTMTTDSVVTGRRLACFTGEDLYFVSTAAPYKVYHFGEENIDIESSYNFAAMANVGTSRPHYISKGYTAAINTTNMTMLVNLPVGTTYMPTSYAEISFSALFPSATKYYFFRTDSGDVFVSSNDTGNVGLYQLNADRSGWTKVIADGFCYTAFVPGTAGEYYVFGRRIHTGSGLRRGCVWRWKANVMTELPLIVRRQYGDNWTTIPASDIGAYLCPQVNYAYTLSNGDVLVSSKQAVTGTSYHFTLAYLSRNSSSAEILSATSSSVEIAMSRGISSNAHFAELADNSVLVADGAARVNRFTYAATGYEIDSEVYFRQLGEHLSRIYTYGSQLAFITAGICNYSNQSEGLVMFDLSTGTATRVLSESASYNLYETADGDLYANANYAIYNNTSVGEPLLETAEKLYRFDMTTKTFSLVSSAMGRRVAGYTQYGTDSLLMIAEMSNGTDSILKIANGTVTAILTGITRGGIDTFLSTSGGDVYISGNSGLYILDSTGTSFLQIQGVGTNYDTIIEHETNVYLLSGEDNVNWCVYDTVAGTYTLDSQRRGGLRIGEGAGCAVLSVANSKLYTFDTPLTITGDAYTYSQNFGRYGIAVDETNKKIVINF